VTPIGTAPRRRLADREGTLAWIFLMPSVIYILVLVAVPFVLAIGFALSDVTAGDPSFDWVGVRNFERVFEDPVFWRSLGNTFVFTLISMALIIVLGKVLANILVADFRGKWFVRFLVLLPWTTPVALSSISWLWMLDSIFSPIDWVLRQLGLLGGADALIKPDTNMYWLGEAARVDGAGYWRRMFEVTIPLVLPVAAVAALFGAIFTFTDMAVVDVLTNGGPNNATQVLTSWAFFRGIDGGDVGQGAAIALFLFPLLLAAAVAILRAVRRMEV
jgi:multiple sugar transport system permease protein